RETASTGKRITLVPGCSGFLAIRSLQKGYDQAAVRRFVLALALVLAFVFDFLVSRSSACSEETFSIGRFFVLSILWRSAVMMSTTSVSLGSSIATISSPATFASTISRTASAYLFSSFIFDSEVLMESIRFFASLSSSLLVVCFDTSGTSLIFRISFG